MLSSNQQAIYDLLSSTQERMDIKTISSKLPDVKDKTGAIEQLLAKGLIWHAGKGRYAVLSVLGMAEGVVRSRQDGSAVVFAGREDPVRVEIDKRKTGGAINGDTVLVAFLEPELHRGGYHGRVVHIRKRGRDSMAGIARFRGGKWFLDPLDPGIDGNIPLDIGDRDVSQGDLVGCEIVYGRHGFTVKAMDTIGSPDSPSALIDSVCLDRGLPGEFTDMVNEAAEDAARQAFQQGSRKDLRDTFCLTVDPVDARDFDDAISIQIADDGDFVLGVHIADVSAFAPRGSAVDEEARARGTSIYLPDRVIPMIPEVLSNGSCSLQPDQDRLTKSVMITYDSQGKRKDFSVFSSMIRSRKRLNYTEALGILNGEDSGDPQVNQCFRDFKRLSNLLEQERKARGAVDLGASEFRTVFGDNGLPEGFQQVPDDPSHRMIENFMIEANRAVSEFCRWLELDVLYRVHGDPVPEAADKLRRTLSIYGFNVPGQLSPSSPSLSKALAEAKDTPLYPLVRDAILRSMQKAVYSPANTGHYGLALRDYMHFTSPIRRYPDLIVHQAITAWENGTLPAGDLSMSDAAEFCSTLERRADGAEREATELMALLYLSGETGKVFRGVVRDKVDFGLFVRLLDVPVEGLVHVSALRKFASLLPASTDPGSEISVVVESSSPLERKLSLLPAAADEGDESDD